jgi:hypothetical protein
MGSTASGSTSMRACRWGSPRQSSQRHGDLLVCVWPRHHRRALREQLRHVYGVYTTVPVALPRPLPALLRSWARADAAEDLLPSLAALDDAIRTQPARS